MVKTAIQTIPKHRYIPWTPMSLPNLLVSTLKLNTSWGTSWGWSYIPLCPAFFGFRVADCRHQQAFVYLSIPPKRTCLSPEISQLDFSFLKPNTKIWTGKNDMDIKYSNTVMLTQEKFTDPYDFSWILYWWIFRCYDFSIGYGYPPCRASAWPCRPACCGTTW